MQEILHQLIWIDLVNIPFFTGFHSQVVYIAGFLPRKHPWTTRFFGVPSSMRSNLQGFNHSPAWLPMDDWWMELRRWEDFLGNLCFSSISNGFSMLNTRLGGGNSNIFYVHSYVGKIPILTNIFQGGWNHQLVERHRDSGESWGP